MRISETEKEHNIDLLLIGKDGKKHYCLIKNLSRLLSKQVTKHDGALVFYRRCLNYFLNKEKLEVHKEYCSNKECARLEMPKIEKDEKENENQSYASSYADFDFEILKIK